MTRKRTYWIYDYETIVNCFIAVFRAYDSDETRVFVINRERNDILKLLNFFNDNIKHNDWHLGYNNLAFDAQITEFILEFKHDLVALDADEISASIAQYASSVINKSIKGEWLDYPEFKLSIKCIDIFKLNHWDNAAKRSSLKWIQFSMDWYNVEEMPHHHTEPVLTNKQLESVVNYCINDVKSTKQIFLQRNSKGERVMAAQINLRAELSKTYGVSLYSASEPRISKEIFLFFLSNKLGKSKKEIRDMRTYRNFVNIRDIILPMVEFNTPEFKGVHNWFKNLVVDTKLYDNTDDKIKGPKYTMMYKGVKTDFGLGGLHGCIKPGIYKSGNGKIILSADVTSFYPNLAIRNQWGPAQFPKKDFCELYEWFFEERKKYDKKNPLNYLFKIILNSTYGLSKERNSFLYDPELTFRITVNGQLQLSMLYEMIAARIPGSQPLMQNTDGLEFLIDDHYEELFFDICTEWELMTNLQLETVKYDKMIIGDVNNYIAVYDNGEVKCKGRFEFKELPYHKNKSFLIIPKALYAYFIDNIDPKDFIKANRDIFDYCAGAKLKGDWFFEKRGVVNGEYESERLQKLVRYYISNVGVKLIKCNPDGREIQLESGKHLQTIFNRYEEKPWDEYGVEDSYYLDKIYEEIHKIERLSTVLPSDGSYGQQLELF
jgi:hypothetical protein